MAICVVSVSGVCFAKVKQIGSKICQAYKMEVIGGEVCLADVVVREGGVYG